MMKHVLPFFMVILVGLYSCEKKSAEEEFPHPPDCETDNVTYSQTIKAILADKCMSCHTGSSMTGYDFSTHEGLKAVADNGKLLASINHTGTASPMPQGMAKLDDCTIQKITKWVNDGAPDN